MRAKAIGTVTGLVILAAAAAALAIPRSQLRGRPEIRVGAELGFFVYVEGSKLHVRWTTTNPDNHNFRGELTVENGALTGLARVNLEDSDRTVLESPQRLVFNAVEHLGLDGFDVDLPASGATLKLMIDNQPADKTMMFLGGHRKNPPAAGEIAIGAR